MRKNRVYFYSVFCLVIIIMCQSCVFDDLKKGSFKAHQLKIDEKADNYFKIALGLIEIHKMRTGEYPNDLYELCCLNRFDSVAIRKVSYQKFGGRYILNILPEMDFFSGDSVGFCDFRYPDEFWNGLGIIESNLMEE